MKEIVDNRVNVPQYLESEMVPAQCVGIHLQEVGPVVTMF
jgi:hypothetical protein